MEGSYQTALTYLISGKSKDFVLEIQFPKIKKILKDEEKALKILKLTAEFKSMDGKKIKKEVELEVQLLNEEEDKALEEADNKEVLKQFYRVKGGEQLDKARRLADSGKNEEA
mmetsp:Transcript_5134/g.4357  ORF Transcript_5134/g.4357 Transcript_5134/m.4357 type:complete len:113 (+) Transcript_5134:22-360(+)